MQLYSASRAPNPRRVHMFLRAKNCPSLDVVWLDLNQGAHRSADFLRISPLATVPALVLDDGRALTETRAICTYLESLYPQPNLMGEDAVERAFIEMADRRAEFYLLATVAHCVRHTHPGLALLEQPQFPEFGHAQSLKLQTHAAWFDAHLQSNDFMAGARFTVADITAFCALEFARGLMRWTPAAHNLHALQAWRDRIAQHSSAQTD